MRYISITSYLFLVLCTGVSYGRWLFPDFCKRPKPWPLSRIRPELYVYTRSQDRHFVVQDEFGLIDIVDGLEKDRFLEADRQVVFLVHGYLGWMPWTKWIEDMKTALLKATDSTVFMVVWAKGADVFYSYPDAASNTQTVAKFLSKLAQTIFTSGTFNGDSNKLYLHCIGHSLGAHICGQAGRLAKVFDRATGLDPAGPGFDDCHEDDKLHIDKDSASCVDNIHTDGLEQGHWLPVIPNFGTLESWGHLDFYPNRGGNQPGCWTNDVPPCSHGAAVQFFRYTVENGPEVCMANVTCEDTTPVPTGCIQTEPQQMGFYSSCHRDSRDIAPGNFYLTTDKKKHYC